MMDKEAQAQCFTTHLIEGDGTFNAQGLDSFIEQVKLEECGRSYAIVAIMGPRSGGKSTLLNHLFHTNFKEMVACGERRQTTRGVWIARCTGIEPCTIVMDIKGTDGIERGEDKTIFEKQSELFAIAVSNITLINMWCHDICLLNAPNSPLLKTVFQAMLQLDRSHKKTLMFIIRDKSRVRFEFLDKQVKTYINQAWHFFPKAEAYKHTQLSDFFNVEVVALSSYEYETEEFKKQVANMRQKFYQSTEPSGLAGVRGGVVPASVFSLTTQKIWKHIKEDKDLDLPSLRVMTANVRCEEIASDIYSSFASNQDWVELSEAVKSHLDPGSGKKLSSLCHNCLSKYDEQVKYYDEKVRTERREQLEEKLTQLVQPAIKLILEHKQSKTLDNFKGDLNNSLNGGQGFAAAGYCTKMSLRLLDEHCKDIEAEAQDFTTHLIEGDGTFNEQGLDRFIKQVKLGECGLSYAIVAIMGPQSRGKSTLLNHLFHTNFKEMDACGGRRQTTKGVWIARCSGIEPCTIVMDIEGTDGTERGEDNTIFEKQSTLFAIAVSDITLINMWCNDIGRVNATNTPLLKAVFQAMLQLDRSRKKTLMFIIRDKSKTPSEVLDKQVKTHINKVWHSVPKAEEYKHTQLSDFFNVEVVALPHYEYETEEFKKQVANMRQKFYQSTEPSGLASDRQGVVPASGFSFTTQKIWNLIKENKDLDLPSIRVMTANVRCEAIASDIYSSFASNQDWVELSEAVKSHLDPGCSGKKLSSLFYNCLSNYDEQIKYYDEKVGSERRKLLKEKLMRLIQPAIELMREHIRSKTLDEFKGELNNALNEGKGFAVAVRDCTKKSMGLLQKLCDDSCLKCTDHLRVELSHDLEPHITQVRVAKLNELSTLYEWRFKGALCSQVTAHLEYGGYDTWLRVRALLLHETASVIHDFSSAISSSFEMVEQEKVQEMISKLKNYGRRLVEEKAREVAENVFDLMMKRFEVNFCHDDYSRPRNWTDDEDIPYLSKTARSSSLRLLSVLAAIRLDGDADTIWNTVEKRINTSWHLWESSSWEEVPEKMTLITPKECKSLYKRFNKGTKKIIKKAKKAQMRDKAANFASSAAGIAVGGVVGTVVATGMVTAGTHDITGTLVSSAIPIAATVAERAASTTKHYVGKMLGATEK